ncbi:tail fiber assembly protein [Pseudomonas sp. GV071]|uniref:tail fiber assembly protein n=1 Tax=Pseudomonas sp. GV071 TaxID=2135754 RepID=UPI000D3441A9|nr:tail fiber assembly protein [Pseudomonas sp. GV071]PTQ68131.1 virus tail fiber assembly protein lambda gpK [Pseudomonas sp. GV071]
MSVIYLIDGIGILRGPVELQEVPGIGIQLPSNAVALSDQLPEPDSGHTWVLIDTQAKQLADHRGTVYSTADRSEQHYELLGDLPEDLTPVAPPSEFHEWLSGAWVLNQDAVTKDARDRAKATRDGRLSYATTRIAPLQDAVDLDEATTTEVEQLRLWKLYRVQLNRIEQQVGFPAQIDWPVAPADGE